MATDKQKAFVRLAKMEGINLHKDWYELNLGAKSKVAALAKAYGYKKSKTCMNSMGTAGNFYYLLQRADNKK